MTVTSAQHVDCYEARVGKGDDRGEDHSDWPIGVLATVCRVTAILCVPLVRSRRRQLLKQSSLMAPCECAERNREPVPAMGNCFLLT